MIAPIVLIGAGLALAAATLAASYISRRRSLRRDPLGASFEMVCGALRMSKAEEQLLRRLAAEMGAAPVTLLISGDALDRGAQGLSAGDAATLVGIRSKAEPVRSRRGGVRLKRRGATGE